MLSPEERYRLLEEASALSERWEYPEVLKMLDVEIGLSDNEPELAYLHALAMFRCGKLSGAYALLNKMAARAKDRGKDRLYCRRVALQGAIHVERGELFQAQECFSETLFIATARGFGAQIATAIMNLGVLASIRCEWDEALAAFERAIVAYEQIGDLFNLAGTHHDLGITYREIGDLTAASTHHEIALIYFQRCNSHAGIAHSLSERALLMKLAGDLELADSTARIAVRSLESIPTSHDEAAALRVLGQILRTKGEYDESYACLKRALDLSLSIPASLLTAEIHEELAELARARTGSRESEHLMAAVQIYHQMGAQKRADRVITRFATGMAEFR